MSTSGNWMLILSSSIFLRESVYVYQAYIQAYRLVQIWLIYDALLIIVSCTSFECKTALLNCYGNFNKTWEPLITMTIPDNVGIIISSHLKCVSDCADCVTAHWCRITVNNLIWLHTIYYRCAYQYTIIHVACIMYHVFGMIPIINNNYGVLWEFPMWE
jgi:hypothetical protein